MLYRLKFRRYINIKYFNKGLGCASNITFFKCFIYFSELLVFIDYICLHDYTVYVYIDSTVYNIRMNDYLLWIHIRCR